MKRIYPHIRYMTPEETSSHDFCNPGLMMEYENLMIPLNAGYTDRIYIYREKGSIYILTFSTRIGYAGLDELDVTDGDIIGAVFLEDYQLRESISRQWYHMKPETLIKRLSDYL